MSNSLCTSFVITSSTFSYKKTLVFDPLKSETYRALQEQGYPTGNYQELPVPAIQPKVFSPNRLVPGKVCFHFFFKSNFNYFSFIK